MLNQNSKPVYVYAPIDDLKDKVTEYYWNEVNAKKKSKTKLRNYLGTHLDKFKYILHYIYLTSVTSRLKLCEDYIPISNAKFEKLIGRQYYSIMEFLHRYYIENDGIYYFDRDGLADGKCLGYRFKQEFYLNTNFYQDTLMNEDFESKLRLNRANHFKNLDNITIEIENSLQMLSIRYNDALDSVALKAETESKELINRYPDMLLIASYNTHGKTFTDVKITVKSDEIETIKKIVAFNKDKANKKKKKLSPRQSLIKKMREDVASFKTSISSRMGSIYRIMNKDQSAARPIAQNRVHTNLTNMASDLRPFLYLDKNSDIELESLDVSNSQPFVLIKVVIDYLHDNGYTLDDTTLHYIHLVSNGQFYEYMKSALGIEEDDKDFKGRMFGRIFYDKNENCIRTLEWKTFNKNFPLVALAIEEKKKDGYEKLSLEMQSIEAQINIDGVLKDLYNKYPDTFFNHIHDSIIFPSGYEAEVKNLMEYHYNRVVGYIPNIKEPEILNEVLLPQAA